ncbi:MAG: hypothetical protein WAM00_04625 [Salegentibacter sp.]
MYIIVTLFPSGILSEGTSKKIMAVLNLKAAENSYGTIAPFI